ncbi:MAG: ATP-dependent Clp protease adaptor ClpS [Planctomycetota bacterium]
MTEAPVFQETIVRPKRRPENERKVKRLPPHAVVLHNDDVNGFDFVIASLKAVFGYTTFRAMRLTLAAHTSGQSQVWTGPLEVAELKADQLRSRGADPERASDGALPLRVTVEPLPSD